MTKFTDGVFADDISTRFATGTRLKVRRVDERKLAIRAVAQAVADNKFVYQLKHGGSVANAYSYRADTEGCLVTATPDGKVCCWFRRLNANKVTHGGVLSICVPEARPLQDDRYGEVRKAEAWVALKEAHKIAPVYGTLEVDRDLLAIIRNAPEGVAYDYLMDHGMNPPDPKNAAILTWLAAA